jgi:prevent-host-death family protein
MTSIPLEQARRELAKLLDQVLAGEEMVITQNGRPVARVTPEPPHRNGATNGVSQPVDLNQFAGTLSPKEDPDAFQRRIRDEWA